MIVKTAFRIIVAGMILVFFFVCSGCKKKESLGSQYTIQVDSIIHPDTISVGDALEIKYYGLIGKTDCFSFYKFDVSFDSDVINTTVIGLNSEGEECKNDSIFLKGKSLNIVDLPAGDFTILVKQQRGNSLESTVHVVP